MSRRELLIIDTKDGVVDLWEREDAFRDSTGRRENEEESMRYELWGKAKDGRTRCGCSESEK